MIGALLTKERYLYKEQLALKQLTVVISLLYRVSNIDCSRSISQAGAVDWITKCIVDEYKFKANENENEWTSQPDFKDVLRTLDFKRRAGEVQKFFRAYDDWESTKEEFKRIFKQDFKSKLLMITAARYLLVTSILYTESSSPKLIPCLRQDGKYVIPLNGVCYPAPYGSASYKSDYDVGLIGPESGSLTKRFNIYFQSTFTKPSELVFDTNVYAFTLEFAIPSMFRNLPWNFQPQVTDDEKTDNYKMQELASAYYKVFKYNDGFFRKLEKGASDAMMVDPRKRELLRHWMGVYEKLDHDVPIRSAYYLNRPQSLRKVHNEVYQGIVEAMSDAKPTPYQPQFLGNYGYLYKGLYKNLVFIKLDWSLQFNYRHTKCHELQKGLVILPREFELTQVRVTDY